MAEKLLIRSPNSSSEWRDYYQLRWEILRKPWLQPLGSERDVEDSDAFHLLALRKNSVVGVGRLQNIDINTGQIRYMAVRLENQRQGIGAALLSDLESEAINRNITTINIDSRENAFDFYLHNGYVAISKGHTLFDAISHIKLRKQL